MIISRTPFRISFFGGGTDYPAWYLKNGGEVLATTINKYCYLTCRYLPPFFEHRIRLVYSKVENCKTVDEIRHPVVHELMKRLNIDRGVEIHHDGDLPARSGMGSSSAFTVGLLHALYALKGQMRSKHELAMESIHVEQELLKETVGSQDQVQAAYGGPNHVTFHPSGEILVRPLTNTRDRMEELQSHLMLFYTGIKRTASDIASTYVDDIEARRSQLLSLGEMVRESISIINSDGDITEFGKLLHEAWRAKRSLSASVSNPLVDDIYDQAISAGAIGGKLTGAGGGGFLILFVQPFKQARVKEKLKNLLHVPFRFDFNGSRIIFFDPGEDYSRQEWVRAGQTIGAFQELADT